ncbi:energy-coupling factor ABC transporter ATP-binding protein [Pararhodospirillum photometricum]|uniref:ABC transporter component n=1 Tax=Pararhodospirillum photometricum DSM 122 TaxID=1150469 RepID=H6SNH5_PARPM|nr:ABC transporter ATP-binding protein [Pararhodospirillum photometricum]CCG09306.1 ABC transporter component [Pararhodospirillum photometricum DSM 122]
MVSLIEVHDVAFAYPGRPRVLDGATLALQPGERLGLRGDNGAGKSTLLRLIVGLGRPTHGEIRAFGRARVGEADFLEVRRRCGYVFQDPDDQLFCPSVLEDVAFGPLNLGQTPAQARARARDALARVGLAGFEERVPHALSGGEKRLVALAGVLAMDPEVLLLDEPTTALDATATARLLALLATLPQAMILVSHDPRAHKLETRAVALHAGRVVPSS